jgi:hypothetical protein
VTGSSPITRNWSQRSVYCDVGRNHALRLRFRRRVKGLVGRRYGERLRNILGWAAQGGSIGRGMRREGLGHSSSWWQSQLQSWQQRTCTPASQGVAGLVGSVITGRTPRHRRRASDTAILRRCSHSAPQKRRSVTPRRPGERFGSSEGHGDAEAVLLQRCRDVFEACEVVVATPPPVGPPLWGDSARWLTGHPDCGCTALPERTA